MEVNVRWLGCQGPGFHEKGKEWKLCQGGVQIWKKNMKKYTGEQFMCGVTEVVTNAQKTFCCGGLVAIGECGAARMARRKWLLEKKVRRHFHNPLDSPGLMSRRRDGYFKRKFVIISTIPMAIAKIGCGPSNFHLQAIL